MHQPCRTGGQKVEGLPMKCGGNSRFRAVGSANPHRADRTRTRRHRITSGHRRACAPARGRGRPNRTANGVAAVARCTPWRAASRRGGDPGRARSCAAASLPSTSSAATLAPSRARCRFARSGPLVLGGQPPRHALARLDVRLIEPMDAEDGTGHRGCELPAEELLAQIVQVRVNTLLASDPTCSSGRSAIRRRVWRAFPPCSASASCLPRGPARSSGLRCRD